MRLILVLFILLPLLAFANTCVMKSTFIPASNMASFVNQYVDAVTPDNSLVNLITSPTGENALAYAKTIMPFIIPIFAFAVIATIFMIVACIQICCVGCCHSQKCKCTSYTYTSIKLLIGFIIVFLLLLIGGGIAGMIFNHDTLAATYNTQCVASQTFSSIVSGSNTTNWDGLTNLTNLAKNISSSFSNNIDTLNTYINGATVNNTFKSLTQNTPSTTFFSQVQTNTQCVTPTPVLNDNVACPDSSQSGCTSTLFTYFCNSTSQHIGSYNLTQEFQSTTNNYANNLNNLYWQIGNMSAAKTTISDGLNNLVTQTQQLSSNSQNYQNTFQNMAGTINHGLYITQIAIYVAYAFLILCSFCSILILTFIFCCRCFKLTGCVQFSWMFYWLMTTIILIISGFQYLASVALVNSCQSYNYFINSQSNFEQLPRNEFTDGYKQCLFTPGTTSMMDGIFTAEEMDPFNNMVNYMNIFNNIGNFSTVATTVYNQVVNLTTYPQYETIQQSTNTQPMAAYNQLNNFANYSASNSQQNCRQLKDFFVFSSVQCGLYPLETGTNMAGSDSCILLSTTTTANNTFSQRNALLSSCTSPNYYETNALGLSAYGQALRSYTLTNLLPSNMFTAYPQAYYNYYLTLNEYLNPAMKVQINSFVQPYNEFYNGLSCQFVTGSVSDIQTQVCNNFNPYLYFLSVINISIGSICFAIMLLFYFLHPRLEFYSLMEGDIDKMMVSIQMQNTNRIELYDTSTSRQ